jgi:hypothetical protein
MDLEELSNDARKTLVRRIGEIYRDAYALPPDPDKDRAICRFVMSEVSYSTRRLVKATVEVLDICRFGNGAELDESLR